MASMTLNGNQRSERKTLFLGLTRGDLIFLAIMLAMIGISAAFAKGTGQGFAFESWLSKLQDSLTGPVAYGIAIIGIVAACAGLAFGGEIGTFMKTMIYLVLIASVLIGANAVLGTLSGNQGAVVPQLTDADLDALRAAF